MSRKHISLKTKLAAALCQMLHDDGTGKLVRIISHEDAKKMTEDQVLSVFEWHHYPIRKRDKGPDTHWNLQPELIRPHREISAKDRGAMSREDRITDAHREFQRKLLAKEPGKPREKKGSIPSRVNAWPKGRKFAAQATR